MSNKHYVQGRNFEYRCKRYLERQGFYVVRSAGSHTPTDLIAFPPNPPTSDKHSTAPLFIQCKYGSGYISKSNIDKLVQLAQSVGAIPILIQTDESRKLKISNLKNKE